MEQLNLRLGEFLVGLAIDPAECASFNKDPLGYIKRWQKERQQKLDPSEIDALIARHPDTILDVLGVGNQGQGPGAPRRPARTTKSARGRNKSAVATKKPAPRKKTKTKATKR